MLYQPENIDDIQIFQDDILHFCSVDLIESDMKNAHEKMIEKFESVGGTIVFDPNVRLPLWEDKLECQRTINAFIPKTHIVKISDEELLFITGKKNEDEAIQSLFRGQVNVVIYTQGAQGATIYTKDDYRIHHEGYQVQAIDTTGAGDAFIGAIIYCILESRHSECKDLFKEKGKDILAFSNRVAALTTTKHGAIESLPTKEDIKDYY